MAKPIKTYPKALCLLALLALCPSAAAAAQTPKPVPLPALTTATWPAMMAEARAAYNAVPEADRPRALRPLLNQVERRFPVPWDWMLQDLGGDAGAWLAGSRTAQVEQRMLERVLAELGPAASALRERAQGLAGTPVGDRRWLDLYLTACEQRRALRLRPLLARWRSFVFAKHFNMGGSHYAYTEGQSDAQAERIFVPGTALCVLEMEGIHGKVRTLLEDPKGVIRNPDVSHDGRRILFAWKKADREDDYHLYEMDVASGAVRPLSAGVGFADYEGVYTPGGDILFNSTRCVQTVDCWWTEVSNLYTCNRDGKFLRRLGFDQVHTNFPTVLPDGRVVYTRWDYNDRGQIFPQPLFQMYPDGTGQTEFYGNNSWFPTTLIHARGIPGSEKVVAVATGHHSFQAGKLALIDTGKGRQENSGVQLIAPARPTPADRIDSYGQGGDLVQYPYPLSEREFLVTYHPLGWMPDTWKARVPCFGIYWVDVDGRRELLAADPDWSCNQPIPLAPRRPEHARASLVDYRKRTGTYYLQDIYAGPGLRGVERGAVKRLRVVALEYRAAGVGSNGSSGPGGGAMSSTPVSIGNGCWDVKVVLGEAPVYEDGSACFQVPARTPLYFQALDEKGYAIQTMRSWSTLQPGETASCVGCHESKSQSALARGRTTMALRVGAQPLGLQMSDVRLQIDRSAGTAGGLRIGDAGLHSGQPAGTAARALGTGARRGPGAGTPAAGTAGRSTSGAQPAGIAARASGGTDRLVARGFSFAREVQPILDRHCISCHNDRGRTRSEMTAEDLPDPATATWHLPRESAWQFTTEAPPTGWEQPAFDSRRWPAGKAGFGRKGTPGGVVNTDWHTPEIWLRTTFSLPAGWERRPLRLVFCHDEDVEIHLNGVLAASAAGYIVRYRTASIAPKALRALKTGENVVAVHCRQTLGGQYVDVALAGTDPPAPLSAGPRSAFSLLSAEVVDTVAKRRWSDAYLNLTGARRLEQGCYAAQPGNLVSWVTAQSIPSLLPAYPAGAARSRLLSLLEDGHSGVNLSRQERERIACWIDLGVPFCGDYTEANAWNEVEKAKYQRYLEKRWQMEAEEARNIEAFTAAGRRGGTAQR